MVAARIAFKTKIADTPATGATFAEKHAAMVGQTLEALRKSGEQHPFARVQHDHAYVKGTVENLVTPGDLG